MLQKHYSLPRISLVDYLLSRNLVLQVSKKSVYSININRRILGISVAIVIFAFAISAPRANGQWVQLSSNTAGTVDGSGIGVTISHSGSTPSSLMKGNTMNTFAKPAGRASSALSPPPPNTTSNYGYSVSMNPGAYTVVYRFSATVYDPVIHFLGAGAMDQAATIYGKTPSGAAATISLTKLTGSNFLNVSSGNRITTNLSSMGTDCGTSTSSSVGCGSFVASGAFSEITIVTNRGLLAAANNYSWGLSVAPVISGVVFEDVNYGGGAGRNLVSSGGVVRPNARVELFNSSGNFVTFTTTDASGKYTFPVSMNSNYTVRVVASSVTSSRTGASAGLIPVQTFRTTATGGVATGDVNRVGGESPELAEAANGSTTLSALNTSTTAANSIASVQVSQLDVSGIDFGFNFDTIVNKNDSGQGSLRQFIANSNALANSGLAQEGQLAGIETSIFMIPDGASHPGLRSGLVNQLTSGVAIISPATALPFITNDSTNIDGITQTINVGNTNSGVDGTGGTVGTSALSLPQIEKPEIQISRSTSGVTTGLVAAANFITIRGLAINGFGTNQTNGNIVLSGVRSDILIEKNFLGSEASSFSSPAFPTTGSNIVATDALTNFTLRNNLIGFAGANGLHNSLGYQTNVLIENNEFRGNGKINVGSAQAGIEIVQSSLLTHSITITRNLLIDNSNQGIQFNLIGGSVISDNTIKANGFAANTQSTERQGILLYFSANTNVTRNIISDNASDGILVTSNASSGNNKFSQNSISKNGGLGIELGPYGTIGGTVTPNDGLIVAANPNQGMDYPILTEVNLAAGTLTLKGFVGKAGAGNTSFGGAVVEFFKANNSPANQNGEVISGDGVSTSHGEGETYLGSLTADANGLINGTLSVTGLSATDLITTTATNTNNNTSEFSPNYTTTYKSATAYKSVKLTTDTNSSGAIDQGDILTYTIVYTNTGNNNLSSLEIFDTLPSEVELDGTPTVTTSGTGTSAVLNTSYTGATSGAVSKLISSGTIKVGGAVYVNVPVKLTATAAGTASNQASGSATELLAAGENSDNAGATADLSSTVSALGITVPAGSVAQTIAAAISPTTFAFTVDPPKPQVDLVKSCLVPSNCTSAAQEPGSDLTYKIQFTNTGGSGASSLIVVDKIPSNTDFKVGSASLDSGTTGLTFTTEYSNDYDDANPSAATWTYTPASAGGGAPSGYDRNVKAIRWRATAGTLSNSSPDNDGNSQFTVRIR